MIPPQDRCCCRFKRWRASIVVLCFWAMRVVPVGYGQFDFYGESESQLIAALKHGNVDDRRHAADRLGYFGGRQAVEALIAAALKDLDKGVRATADAALGRIKDPRAVAPLIAALKDSNEEVRGNAAWALGDILGDIKGPRAVEPLIGALKDSNEKVRGNAALALKEIKDPRAVEPLIAALKDSNEEVRGNAAWALGDIKDPRAVEPLIGALKDLDKVVRAAAAGALGKIQDPRAVEPLIAAHEDPDDNVGQVAFEALVNIMDARAEEFLLRIPDAWVLVIKRGKAGSEGALIRALNASEDEEMAQAFLSSGNSALEAAAREWAAAHDLQVVSGAGPAPVRWGSRR